MAVLVHLRDQYRTPVGALTRLDVTAQASDLDRMPSALVLARPNLPRELPVGCVRLLLATPIALVLPTPMRIPTLAHDSLRRAASARALRPADNSAMFLNLP